MNNIYNEEYINGVAEELRLLFRQLNTLIISRMTKGITDIKAGQDVGQALKLYQKLSDDVTKAIAKARAEGATIVEKGFAEVLTANMNHLKANYNRDGALLGTVGEDVQRIIQSSQKQALKELENICQTQLIRFKGVDGRIYDVREQYIKLIETAAQAVKRGELTADRVLRKMIKTMTDGGIRYADFASGTTRRIDSQIHMNFMDTLRAANRQSQEEVGRAIGADGVEISAHALCAPDHIKIQGKQYSNEEFKELESRLERPIGAMNCRHRTIPIVMGVSEPAYTREQLDEMVKLSEKKVTYNGKTYTRYEASQLLRQHESRLRALKLERKTFEQINDTTNVARKRSEIRRASAEYRKLCEEVGLSPRKNRTTI